MIVQLLDIFLIILFYIIYVGFLFAGIVAGITVLQVNEHQPFKNFGWIPEKLWPHIMKIGCFDFFLLLNFGAYTLLKPLAKMLPIDLGYSGYWDEYLTLGEFLRNLLMLLSIVGSLAIIDMIVQHYKTSVIASGKNKGDRRSPL
ncbi:MAG: hypothetical protein A3I05_04570 [Deltaproteobacteria bacterium RIFCSPLOWO2_02_FULL_44_10]|nr:MAG: hypothetical protein A3C46_07375 [Deltaproteobacteria bacterium RIFCSPHIGHO2_02_FULL_44_16]OGQ46631.1 MAG: hypothetical protein A3I05_04570 [Deltaproteobacteria bacterium RIFCSPLOWO2_02_FULL_44_10]